LKAADLLDVAGYPFITYESDRLKFEGEALVGA